MQRQRRDQVVVLVVREWVMGVRLCPPAAPLRYTAMEEEALRLEKSLSDNKHCYSPHTTLVMVCY